MKSIWKGTLSCGLVNFEVSLVTAVQPHIIGFTLLHEKCKSPIKYKRWCEHCKEDVLWNDIVKGLKVGKNDYIILTKDMLKKLKPLANSELRIKYFVNITEIPAIFYENHYYVVPLKAEDSAFSLFCEILHKTQKTGIGSFVMKEKDHVGALTSYGSVLVLSTLYYPYEIKSPPVLKKVKTGQKEFALGEQLIHALTEDSFSLAGFKDTFVERLKKSIKSGRRQRISVKPEPKKHAAKSKSLLSSLEGSLESVTPRKSVRKRKKS